MLGKVTSVDQSGEKPWLRARTFTLVARAKVTFKNGAGTKVKRVRARALKFKSGKNINDYGNLGFEKNDVTVTAKSGSVYDNLLEATEPVVTDIDAPKLNGWFEAVLDKDVTGKTTEGGLQACEGIVDNSTATNEIVVTIDPSDMKDYTNCVFFPIAPGNYDLIVFEYSTLDADATTDGAENWQYIGYATGNIDRTWKMGDFEGENKASNDLTIETALKINADYIQNCEAVSKVMLDNTIKEAPVIININPGTPGENVKTINSNVESQYTIYIPQLRNDMTVNLKTKTILNKKLVIKDVANADNKGFTIKFNFNDFQAGKINDIEISTSAKELKLEGKYTNLTAAYAVKVLNNSNVTVVSEDSPTSIINLTNEGTGTIAVDGNATNNLAITTLNAGTANKVKVAGDKTKTTITTLNADDCDDVEVGGGTVSALGLSDNAAKITVNGNGVVNSIEPDATISSSLLTNDVAITVNSADNGIINDIKNVSPSSPGLLDYTLSSKFTNQTDIDNAAQTDKNEIYTAAQLNSIAGWKTAAKLKTAIEIESGATWTSPTLKIDFDGNEKAITKLNAPLFGEIGTAVTSITKLNITDAAITAEAAKCGVLAKVSKATNLAVTSSTVQGSITSAFNFVGGLIGQVDATSGDAKVTFGTDAAASGATATVTANVILTNNKAYDVTDVLDVTAGTWGEYVGSVVGASSKNAEVVVNFDCAGATTPNKAKALGYGWKRSAAFDANYKVQVQGYLKPTTSTDNSNTDCLWIGFAGTSKTTIPVVAPTDITKVTLTYPMTVNGINTKVTFTASGSALTVGDTNYTCTIDGLGQNDMSGKKSGSSSPYTATIYHNAYTATAY